MYHRFAEVETDEWTRSYDNFYNDLLYLYEHGYRSISLSDYINNNIKVPVGCTPIIFTFDDGTKGQFNFIRDENNNLIVNPKSAVGIMEKFYSEYPDFGLNGTFYINKTGYFGTEGTRKEKLEYLINKGFEIGNHTNTHINFSKATSENEVIKEVGAVSKEVYELTGYKINSLALPFGSMSKTYENQIIKGVYEDIEYENKALLLVGANPTLSPNHEKLNLLRLPRVRARGGNKEVECDLYWWLEKMEANPELKYYRLSNNNEE
ncbi:MAG: polysaccharide deacetylase family protein [Clostridia bacterium]|nr:polysaccharide deacetylase family protein [Clostridia bacterium]